MEGGPDPIWALQLSGNPEDSVLGPHGEVGQGHGKGLWNPLYPPPIFRL